MTNRRAFKIVRNLALIGVILAFCVVVLGAYTRLTDAGLGCPDWPGCYGHLTVPSHPDHIEAAQAKYDRPLEPKKAWNEMVHRYFAGSLGLLVLVLAIFVWRKRHHDSNFPVKLPTILAAIIIFQALLGMWTVTMKLNPLVVMTHLLGGFTVLSLLLLCYVLFQRRVDPNRLAITSAEGTRYKWWGIAALVMVGMQVALGGWTAANYAATACLELPICHAGWWEHADFVEGLTLWHHAENYEFGIKTLEGRVAVHVLHRIGAFITLAVVLFAGWRLTSAASRLLNRVGYLLIGLVIVQFTLGVLNIVLHLPLANAVAHNAVGALLVAVLVALNGLLWSARNIAAIRG